MTRAQKKSYKSNGFKKGHVPAHKGKIVDSGIKPSIPINRIHHDVYKDMVKNIDNKVHTVNNSQGKSTSMMILRPKKPTPSLVDMYMKPEVDDPDSYTYKLFVPAKVEYLWNNATKEHKKLHSECNGNLYFDSHDSIQKGMAWNERLTCNECKYKSI